MNYTILHLDPDERVVLEVRKHWIVFAGFAVSTITAGASPSGSIAFQSRKPCHATAPCGSSSS